jgi:hypothetical protein
MNFTVCAILIKILRRFLTENDKQIVKILCKSSFKEQGDGLLYHRGRMTGLE